MKRAMAIAALVATVLIAAPDSSPAEAANGATPTSSRTRQIPIENVTDVVVDWPRGQAIISEGGATRSLLAITLTGEKIRRFPAMTGTALMGLSQDGASVWVAIPDQHRVARVDLTTLTFAEDIQLGAAACPRAVVETATKIVVSEPCTPNEDDLLVYDPVAAEGVRIEIPTAVNHLAVSPAGAGLVAVAARSDQMLIDVGGATPTVVAHNTNLSNQSEVAFNLDGSVVYFQSNDTLALSAADLSLIDTFEYDRSHKGIAVGPLGDHLAYVTEPGNEITINLAADPNSISTRFIDREIESNSLAWSGDERWMFAISFNSTTDRFLWNAFPGLGWPLCNGLEPTYLGSMGDDTIEARGVILARDGNDTITADRTSTVCGGKGDDTIRGWLLDDWIHGGAGNDTITGWPGNDVLIGGAGNDTLEFADEQDVSVDLEAGLATIGHDVDLITEFENVVGSAGHDTIKGTDGPNVLVGGSGRDVIDGRGGPDVLEGKTGDDVLMGGPGHDTLNGGGGRDLLAGEKGNDALGGDGGIDTISYASAARGIIASLAAGTATGQGADTITAVESIVGSSRGDRLEGDDGDNFLDGARGPDELFGNSGADFLAGGKGTDSADGGPGVDSCIGAESTTACEQAFGVMRQALRQFFHHAAGATRATDLFPGRL